MVPINNRLCFVKKYILSCSRHKGNKFRERHHSCWNYVPNNDGLHQRRTNRLLVFQEEENEENEEEIHERTGEGFQMERVRGEHRIWNEKVQRFPGHHLQEEERSEEQNQIA